MCPKGIIWQKINTNRVLNNTSIAVIREQAKDWDVCSTVDAFRDISVHELRCLLQRVEFDRSVRHESTINNTSGVHALNNSALKYYSRLYTSISYFF